MSSSGAGEMGSGANAFCCFQRYVYVSVTYVPVGSPEVRENRCAGGSPPVGSHPRLLIARCDGPHTAAKGRRARPLKVGLSG